MESEVKPSPSHDSGGEKHRKRVADVFLSHEKDAQTSIELYLKVLGTSNNQARLENRSRRRRQSPLW